jgi:hypothetical protein
LFTALALTGGLFATIILKKVARLFVNSGQLSKEAEVLELSIQQLEVER